MVVPTVVVDPVLGARVDVVEAAALARVQVAVAVRADPGRVRRDTCRHYDDVLYRQEAQNGPALLRRAG